MNAITVIANALLNTLWQAVALAFLVWLGMRFSPPRLNAATRHIVWWIALAAIFFLGCIPRSAPSKPASRQTPTSAAASAPVRVALPLTPPEAEGVVTVTETRSAVWPFLFAAIWAAFGACRITRVIRSYYRLRCMKCRGTLWNCPLPGLTRRVRVLISPDVSSPVAVGFLHPAVLLPENLREQLTAAEMDFILLHESAHLARYDDWENLTAQLVATVAGLHPVAWWILGQIKREREMACDEWVVARTGAALPYAESLMRLLERKLAPEHSVLATGIFTRRSQLRARIELLLRRGREFTTAAARIPVGVAAVALAGLVMAGALAPNWIAFAQQPEFEVASVKHGDPKHTGYQFRNSWHGGPGTSDPGAFVAENTTLAMLASHAYDTKYGYQLEWKSPWMQTEFYDVTAKVPAGATKEQFAVMLQRLLDQRFGLVVHRETRQLHGYRMVVAEKGAKFKKSLAAAPASSQPSVVVKNKIPQFSDSAGTGTLFTLTGAVIRGRHETMTGLARQLIQQLHAPVIDATGLEGEYDYDVSFAPEPVSGGAIIFPPGAVAAAPQQGSPASPDSQPTLLTALQAQLGLKLEAVKSVPVEVVVLDKANRDPTVN